MKILLLGEYSALYSNLKEGLMELGHEVAHASAGDGWKKISSDIDIGSGVGALSGIKRKILPIANIRNLVGYDVVQYINPFQIDFKINALNRIFFNYIVSNNKRFYISAAGDDSFYWREARNILRYGPFEDYLKYDLRKKQHRVEKPASRRFNEWLLDLSDGVIPIMYEYELAYKERRKLKKTIPIPINLGKINFLENIVHKKLIVFHGLSRVGFKGTRHVIKAFDYLNKTYPDHVECIIKGNMPLKEYLNLMSRVNVVVDQTNFYSLGVNGVYALAMGKVVLGGAEPESLRSLNVTSSPVINITPSHQDIIDQVEKLLDSDIAKIGRESREFCEKVHDHINVAQQYVDVWGA